MAAWGSVPRWRLRHTTCSASLQGCVRCLGPRLPRLQSLVSSIRFELEFISKVTCWCVLPAWVEVMFLPISHIVSSFYFLCEAKRPKPCSRFCPQAFPSCSYVGPCHEAMRRNWSPCLSPGRSIGSLAPGGLVFGWPLRGLGVWRKISLILI